MENISWQGLLILDRLIVCTLFGLFLLTHTFKSKVEVFKSLALWVLFLIIGISGILCICMTGAIIYGIASPIYKFIKLPWRGRE